MNAAVFRQALLVLVGLVLPISGSFAAEPLSEEESEKLFDEASEPLPGFQGCVNDFAFSPDGRKLVGVGGPYPKRTGIRANKIIHTTAEYVIWQTATWEYDRQIRELPKRSTRATSPGYWGSGPVGRPRHASFLGDGEWLAVVADTHQLRLFQNNPDARNRKLRWVETQSLSLADLYSRKGRVTYVKHPSWAPVRISPDQKWLALPTRHSAYTQGNPPPTQPKNFVELWALSRVERTSNTEPKLTDDKTLERQTRGEGPPSDMDFGLGGKILITTSSDAQIRIWDPESGEIERAFSFAEDLPNDLKKAGYFDNPDHPSARNRQCHLAVSPNGKTLAVSCSGIMRLYDLQADQWKDQPHLDGGKQSGDIAFHPSGRWIISEEKNYRKGGFLILWSVPRLEPALMMRLPEEFKRHQSFRLTFSPDGKTMVNSGYTPRRWDFGKLLQAANVRVRQ